MLLFQGHNPDVTGLAFSPDGRTLAATGAARLEFWTVTKGATPDEGGLARHGGPTDNVRFDPSGRWSLVAAGHCGLYAVDVRTRSAHQVNPLLANAVSVSSRGRIVVANLGLTAFDVGTEVDGEQKWQQSIGRGEPVKGLDFFPDGERFVTVEEHRQSHGPLRVTANIRSAADGKVLERNGLACGRGRLVRVSPDGNWFVVQSTNSLLFMHTADPAASRWPPAANRSHITGLAFHPSGRYVAATSNDATVRLYDRDADWAIARTFDWSIGRLKSVAFSSDGCLAAAGGEKGRIVVWDVDL